MHWRLSEVSAIGVDGASQIEIFPAAPARSAQWRLEAGGPIVWELAAISPHPMHTSLPEEVYDRQGDLIVRYQQGSQDRFAYQLDWQLLPVRAPFVGGIELWLSVQTDLLDSKPELEIACQANADHCWRTIEHRELLDENRGLDVESVSETDATFGRGPAALVCMPTAAANAPSGLWLIEPSDQCHARLTSANEAPSQCVRLFGHFMEKGVIRRARMRFLVATGALSTADIRQAYRDLADSPLPLTA